MWRMNSVQLLKLWILEVQAHSLSNPNPSHKMHSVVSKTYGCWLLFILCPCSVNCLWQFALPSSKCQVGCRCRLCGDVCSEYQAQTSSCAKELGTTRTEVGAGYTWNCRSLLQRQPTRTEKMCIQGYRKRCLTGRKIPQLSKDRWVVYTWLCVSKRFVASLVSLCLFGRIHVCCLESRLFL